MPSQPQLRYRRSYVPLACAKICSSQITRSPLAVPLLATHVRRHTRSTPFGMPQECGRQTASDRLARGHAAHSPSSAWDDSAPQAAPAVQAADSPDLW